MQDFLRNAASHDGFALYDPVPVGSALRWRAVALEPFRPEVSLRALTRTGTRALWPTEGEPPRAAGLPVVLHRTDAMLVVEYPLGASLAELVEGLGGLPSRALQVAIARAVVGTVQTLAPRDVPPLAPATVRILEDGQVWLGGEVRLENPSLTYGYLSVEQIRGFDRDVRSSVFVVGALLHWLATGRHPFVGGSDFDTLERTRNAELPATSPAEEADPLYRLACACLQRAPEERVVDLDALDDQLQELADGDLPADALGALLAPFAERWAVEREEQAGLRALGSAALQDLPPLLVRPIAPGAREREREEARAAIQQTLDSLERSNTLEVIRRMELRVEALLRGLSVVPKEDADD